MATKPSETEPLAPVPASQPPVDVQPVELQFDTSAAPAPDSEAMTQVNAVANAVGGPGGFAAVGRRIRENANHLLETRKPLTEFLDRSAMSKPASIGEVTSRLQKNMAYYRTNYFIFFLGTMAITFLMHPSALIWTGLLLVMWVYLFLVNTGPLTIGGREYSEREKLIGASVVSFVVVFFLTSVATTALYGLSISMAMIAVHGAFREPDDLFLDDAGGNQQLFANNMFQGIPGIAQPPASSNMV